MHTLKETFKEPNTFQKLQIAKSGFHLSKLRSCVAILIHSDDFKWKANETRKVYSPTWMFFAENKWKPPETGFSILQNF